jgi:hypothetical protein
MLGTVLVVILVVALRGALPRWLHSTGWWLLSEQRIRADVVDCHRTSATRSNLESCAFPAMPACRSMRVYA